MRVRVTHRKQLARQKFSHQTIPVIRSIKSVQLMYWFFYFTDFLPNKGLESVALRPPPVTEKGSKALSEIRNKRKHIYVQRIATVFQTVNLKIKSVDEG